MGGIFNTPGTLAIIQVLNQAHERTNFRTLSNDAGYIHDLQTSVGTLSTYNLCVKHRLITVDPTFNNRWNTWLNYFDAHGGGNIRNQMASALRGQQRN